MSFSSIPYNISHIERGLLEASVFSEYRQLKDNVSSSSIKYKLLYLPSP